MKTKSLKITAMLLILAGIFVSCQTTPNEDKIPMQYIKTVLGGCNNERNNAEEVDTVGVSVVDGNIHVFVGKNYTCSAPFETQCEILNDTVYMYIIDSCKDFNECYERCICYYTFDFVFEQGEFNQPYKIILIDPRKETPEIIDENNFQNKLQTK
jgi:hypothetical protein